MHERGDDLTTLNPCPWNVSLSHFLFLVFQDVVKRTQFSPLSLCIYRRRYLDFFS